MTAAPIKRRKRTTELSARERMVLSLIAKGFTAREIGERLDIAAKTAECHACNIYRKLNITRKAEAVLEAVHLGLA